MNEPYYKAYEKRYQVAFSAGAERWGHSPDDEVLYNTLKSWVEENIFMVLDCRSLPRMFAPLCVVCFFCFLLVLLGHT